MVDGNSEQTEERHVINVIFCDRCGTIYGKIKVSDTLLMPMCRVCHMELFRYFVDEDGKFIHYGNEELFAEIAEKLEAHTAEMGFVIKRAMEKPRHGIKYCDFVNEIRERTRRMTLIKARYNPQTVLGNKVKEAAQSQQVVGTSDSVLS